MSVLSRDFYSRSPVTVAKELVGKKLVRRLPGGKTVGGIIVETEAYGGAKDPASHAYRGITSRNVVMFGEAGHAYVYFTYGAHHCLNFVTGKDGEASAVLIRSIRPTVGLSVMSQNRKRFSPEDLASGPGKLCQALAIDRRLNGIDVTTRKSPIFVLNQEQRPEIVSSFRVGIRVGKDRKWRFYAKGNRFVSK
ncbi:MAG: DNA-3-methyladenine glycosylase [Nitrososphaerota archaeon]|nr:DNA-3-methyladenine glycosylase [Nitrososphaerota archaeon]